MSSSWWQRIAARSWTGRKLAYSKEQRAINAVRGFTNQDKKEKRDTTPKQQEIGTGHIIPNLSGLGRNQDATNWLDNNYVTGDSSGNGYLGNSEKDVYLYFYEGGSPTGEYIMWRSVQDDFYLSDDATIFGTLTVSSSVSASGTISSSQSIYAGGDIYTTGAGDDLWLGNSTQASASFRAYASGNMYALGNVDVDGRVSCKNLGNQHDSGVVDCILWAFSTGADLESLQLEATTVNSWNVRSTSGATGVNWYLRLKNADDSMFLFGSTNDASFEFTTTGDGYFLLGVPDGTSGRASTRTLIVADFTDARDENYDNSSFDFTGFANPTIYIHSANPPDTNPGEYIVFGHDQTDPQIQTGTGDFQFNSGGYFAGSLTMDTCVLPVKTTTGDPGSPVEGQIYVNTFDNKIRVYADGAWRDLVTW